MKVKHTFSAHKGGQRCSGGSELTPREHAGYESDADIIQAAHQAHGAQKNGTGPEWPMKPGSCWQSALLLLSMIICIDHASKNLLEHPPAACGCPGWRTTCAIFKSPVCFLCGQLLLKSKDTQVQMIGCSSSLVTCPGVELDVGLHVAAPQ